MSGVPAEQAPLSLTTQATRFVITGGLSAVVDFGLYVLLYKVAGVQPDLAKAIGFIAGTTTAYLINRRWTFQAPPSTARLIAVWALYLTTFFVQVGLNHLFLGAAELHAHRGARGLCHRSGHRDCHQLHRPARRDFPAALSRPPVASLLPSDRLKYAF